LRFFRLAALLNRFASTVKSIFNSKGLRFIVYATIGIVLFFGFLFYISEPAVQTYSDGLWWALVTITTVGYGDITPLTNLGRIIASALMIMGIGFIATITAAVSSYFISSFGDRDITMNDLAKKLDKLEVEIQYLKKENNGK
jgi:voltage-gated potassium channel